MERMESAFDKSDLHEDVFETENSKRGRYIINKSRSDAVIRRNRLERLDKVRRATTDTSSTYASLDSIKDALEENTPEVRQSSERRSPRITIPNTRRYPLRRDGSLDSSESDESVSKQEDDVTEVACTENHSDGKTVADFVVPCDVYTLFTKFFSNSKFYRDFQTARETTNLLLGEWIENGEQTCRTNSYKVRLTQSFGPKYAMVTENQVLLPITKPGYLYAVNMETNNSEVPHADSFYMTFHLCLTRVTEKESRMVVTFNIKYRKSVFPFIKSLIDKSTTAGVNKFYADLERSLKEEFSDFASGTSILSPDVCSEGEGQVRRRTLRKKRPAPSIPTKNLQRQSWKTKIPKFLEIRQPPWKIEILLKFFLILSALLLLGFNTYLLLRVKTLEKQVEYSEVNIVLNSPDLTKTLELANIFQEKEAEFDFAKNKWKENMSRAITNLQKAEHELSTLQNLVKKFSK